MIASISHWIACLVGAWLVGISLFMAVAPRRALSALGAMGGTNTVHFGEMALRSTAGIAFIVAGPISRFPAEVAVVGWFLVASAVVLVVLPRRWHAAYSQHWARHISVLTVRLLAPFSAAGGAVVIWTFT